MRVMTVLFIALFIVATAAAFPIEAFKVTGASASVSEPEYRGFCPHKFIFTGRITANRPGTVRYRWLGSDGGAFPEETLAFAASGSKTVSTSWQLGGTMGTYRGRWMRIEVLAPNSLFSNKAVFDLECLPRMRMERKMYKVSGRAIAGGAHVDWLAGLQLKFKLISGTRTVSSCTAAFTRDGICDYSLTVFNAPGSYRVEVEPVHPADPDKFYLCFNSVTPAFLIVTLTGEVPEAANKNFTLAWSWRHLDMGEDHFDSPCW